MAKYYAALQLVQSDDYRKVARGRSILEAYKPHFQSRIEALDIEILKLIADTTLQGMPVAQEVRTAIENIGMDFFDADYYHLMIASHSFELTRRIFRDQMTERRGLDGILKDFLLNKSFSHSRELKHLFTDIESHSGILYELEAYA